MSLLNTAAGVGENKATTEAENMQTANAILNKPKKVSSRPVEPVPFNAAQSQAQVDFAKGNAAQGSVSKNSLVQTQLKNVLATDGPLLKRARTDGFASAAERGLNNSSMGVQAGEEAVVRQALQIATPDAQTYGEMDRANLSSAAGMAQAGVGQAFTDYNNDKNYNFTAGENQLNRDQQSELQKNEQQFTSGENLLNRTQQKDLQASEQQFTSGENTLSREQQLALQKGDQAFQSGENTLSREQQLAMQKGDQEFQSGQQTKQNEFASSQQAAAHGYQLEEIKANADEQIRVTAEQVDDKFKSQYLDSAATLQRGYLDQQTAILSNTSLKGAQIDNALAVAKKNFEASVSWMQGVYAQGGPKVDVGAFPAFVGPVQSGSAISSPPPAQTVPSNQPGGRYSVMGGR